MECLNLVALQQRKNLVYALPTSGGKTLVAEIVILRELVCRRKNAVLILPYVAIVQEKVKCNKVVCCNCVGRKYFKILLTKLLLLDLYWWQIFTQQNLSKA